MKNLGAPRRIDPSQFPKVPPPALKDQFAEPGADVLEQGGRPAGPSRWLAAAR